MYIFLENYSPLFCVLVKTIDYFVSVEVHFELSHKDIPLVLKLKSKNLFGSCFLILFILFSLLVLYNLQVRFLQSNAIYTYCGEYTFRVYDLPAG